MVMDPHANLLEVTVAATPASPTTQTVIGISNADRTALINAGMNPSTDGAFNASMGPATGRTPANTEIIRPTALGAVDSYSSGLANLTITRNAESGGQTGHSVASGDVVKVTITKKTLTDVENLAKGYKIVASVTANNLTVALKTIAGNDPSSSDPVVVRIGDTIRRITAALSVTKNAGTNWFGSGGSQFATKEIDYFVYLGYNATDGVVIGFARIPSAYQYSDFSATTTHEKYAAISTVTNAVSTDYYELIGRFAATLSAGAGYTWTVPTFTAINLIQKPIFKTRLLNFAIDFTGFSVNPTQIGRYYFDRDQCTAWYPQGGEGTSNAITLTMSAPIASASLSGFAWGPFFGRAVDNGGEFVGVGVFGDNAATLNCYKSVSGGVWTGSGSKGWQGVITYKF